MSKASITGYNLRKYKKICGRAGAGFECDLYLGNTKVAYVVDWGDGGCMDTTLFWDNRDRLLADFKKLLSHASNKVYGLVYYNRIREYLRVVLRGF